MFVIYYVTFWNYLPFQADENLSEQENWNCKTFLDIPEDPFQTDSDSSYVPDDSECDENEVGTYYKKSINIIIYKNYRIIFCFSILGLLPLLLDELAWTRRC